MGTDWRHTERDGNQPIIQSTNQSVSHVRFATAAIVVAANTATVTECSMRVKPDISVSCCHSCVSCSWITAIEFFQQLVHLCNDRPSAAMIQHCHHWIKRDVGYTSTSLPSSLHPWHTQCGFHNQLIIVDGCTDPIGIPHGRFLTRERRDLPSVLPL